MLLTMKEILKKPNEIGFAIPAFNISSYAMFNGVMEACEEMESPVIIAIHPDELSHVGEDMIQAVRARAHRSFIPVCIHLDHGSDFAQIMTAIRVGYTSVMIDGSALPFEENIALCKKVCEAAQAAGISVEGELGTIGTTDSTETAESVIVYTDPADAEIFVKETGVDTLAIAIGTCHGLYPEGMKPQLRLDLLKEIKARVSIPIVLHGGSNNPDEEIAEAVRLGVNKINISSDIKAAYYIKMREILKDGGLREPNLIEPECIKALKEVAIHKIRLFCADQKAGLY